MTRRNYEKARQQENMERWGSEATDGSSPVPPGPGQRPRREGPDAFPAVKAARYAVTDVGVRFAREAAAQGLHVVYAADWSPGDVNLDKLAAAGVEVVICKGKAS